MRDAHRRDSCRSREDLCLLALELGVRDVSPGAEIGELSQLVRRALRSRGLLDISAELLVLLALVRTACYCILPPRAIR